MLALISKVFRILKSDTRRLVRSPDVVRGVISVRYFIKYPTYQILVQYGVPFFWIWIRRYKLQALNSVSYVTT